MEPVFRTSSQLDVILQCGERRLLTINYLLDIAKIEANKMPVLYTQTGMREYLESIILPLKLAARRKTLNLEFRFLGLPFEPIWIGDFLKWPSST
ncbi:hypothetical protein [Algoriphagus jejuensis]|uniref:hypothetical protein n=1 Tax=Algoriphagus jejuensis TaxID=419934 RepID=UPI0031DAFB00